MMSEKECAAQLKQEIASYEQAYKLGFIDGFEKAKKTATEVFWKEWRWAFAEGCDSHAAAELGTQAILDMEVEKGEGR